jgi:TolB protein
MNADGSGQRRLTSDVFGGSAWSPDGQKIAFERDHHRKFVPGAYTPADSNIEIYVINADGSRERRLTRNAGNHFGAVWSPTGEDRLQPRRRLQSNQIYIMNADGSGQRG